MLKIFFLCILTNNLVDSATNYDVFVGRTISGSSFEPFNEVSMKDGRQCISICTYNKKCKAFDVQPVPNGIECRFFAFDHDSFVRNGGVLVNKNGVKLYFTRVTTFKTCQELYKAGFRKKKRLQSPSVRTPQRKTGLLLHGGRRGRLDGVPKAFRWLSGFSYQAVERL